MQINPITLKADARKFGLNTNYNKFAENLDEMRNLERHLIVVKAKKNFTYIQNRESKGKLKKGRSYIMSLGLYYRFNNINPRFKILEPSGIKFNKIYRPYNGENLDNKKIFFMRHGGIGDLLFINPILRHIKKTYNNPTITLSCGPQYHSMTENWNEIDKLLSVPTELQNFLSYDYHAVFDGVIERNKEAESKNAYLLFRDWLQIKNLDEKNLIPKQTPKEENIEYVLEKFRELNIKQNDKFILFQITSSSPVRTPREEFWIKVIQKFVDNEYNIIITDSPHKSQYIDNFIDKINNGKKYIKNFSQFSRKISDSIALCSFASGVMAVDSAFIHIGASLKIPVFGIYGPFTGEIRMETYKNAGLKADWINGVSDCSPCFLHGQDPCPHNKNKFPICFDNIDINEVYERSTKIFNLKEI